MSAETRFSCPHCGHAVNSDPDAGFRPAVRPATPEAEGPTLSYDELAAAYREQIAHTDFVRAEYQERLRVRIAANAALRAAAEYVVACDNQGFRGALPNAIDRLRAALAPAASSDPNPEGNRRE